MSGLSAETPPNDTLDHITDSNEDNGGVTCPICLEPLNIDDYFDYQYLKQICDDQIDGPNFISKKTWS